MTAIASPWGGAGNNSYVGLTAADSILSTTVIDYTAWTNATLPQREAALVQASRDIDALQYIGIRYYYDQNLEFPRQLQGSWPWNYVYSTTAGSPLGDVEQYRMKDRVEQATAQQALFLLRSGGRNQDLERQRSGVSGFSEAIGPLSVSVQYGGAGGSAGQSAQARLSPEALSLLADYRTTKQVFRA